MFSSRLAQFVVSHVPKAKLETVADFLPGEAFKDELARGYHQKLTSFNSVDYRQVSVPQAVR